MVDRVEILSIVIMIISKTNKIDPVISGEIMNSLPVMIT